MSHIDKIIFFCYYINYTIINKKQKMPETLATPATPIESTRLWEVGKPERGFTVEMLPERPTPVAIKDAFTGDMERAADLYERYKTGNNVRIVRHPSEVADGETILGIEPPAIMIPEEKFRAAVDEDKIAPELVEELEREGDLNMASINGERATRYKLAGTFPDEEEAMVWEEMPSAARKFVNPDWLALRHGLVERQGKLSQIVRFAHGEKGINLYNFTNSQLTEEHVGQMANAIREMSELTGGKVFDILEVMAVIPNDDDEVVMRDEKGKIKAISSGGAVGSGVMFAEKVFNPDSPTPDQSGDVPPPNLLALHEQVSDEVPFHVPGESVQLFTAHEIMHVIANNGVEGDKALSTEYAAQRGWEYPANGSRNSLTGAVLPTRRGNPEAPTVYARMNHDEEMGVASEAHMTGGKWEERYADQLTALSGLLRTRRHSGVQGPMFVRATELPLPTPNSKLGRLPDVPIAILPSYQYEIY